MLRKSIFLVITTASLVTITVLTLRILCREGNTTAGVLTLKFNLTSGLSGQPPFPAIRNRNLFQDIQSGANGLLDVAATKVSDAAGHVQSAVSSAATFLQEIEEHVPQNCSLGTRQFCVGYKNDLQCSDLPFNLSSLLPDGVQDLPDPVESMIRERVDALSPLADSLAQFTALYVSNTLVAGLVLMVFMAAFSIWLAFDRLSCIAMMLRKLHIGIPVLTLLVWGLACCSPLIVLVSITRMLMDKADELPSWVEVKRGEVCGLGFGALGCALVLALLAAGAPAIEEW